jgi:uncharacterized protein
MKVFVHKIGLEGIELEQTFPGDIIGLTGRDEFRFIKPITVRAGVHRAEDEVIAEVVADSRYVSFCGRCLETIQRDWRAAFTLIFDMDGKTDFIEMDEDIRQELILNLPMYIVCREDCRGLCIDCGANLNNEHCACVGMATKEVKVKM